MRRTSVLILAVVTSRVLAAVNRTYTYGLQRISEYQPISYLWTPSFYQYDGMDSVRQLTNSAGHILHRLGRLSVHLGHHGHQSKPLVKIAQLGNRLHYAVIFGGGKLIERTVRIDGSFDCMFYPVDLDLSEVSFRV